MFGIIKKIIAFAGSKKQLLVKAMAVAFVGAFFAALQFGALMLVLDTLTGVSTLALESTITGISASVPILLSLLVMLLSIGGRAVCLYYATNAETVTGYGMVAEKRIHIGDRLRYIPMGYFNQSSLGDITATVTTTLSDIENSAARSLVLVLGGFLNTMALCIGMCIVDFRIGAMAIAGILIYLVVTELSQRSVTKTAPKRQRAQETLVEMVMEYIKGMSVVKAYGLEKDNGQAVNQMVDNSCSKNLALTYSAVPWAALRYLTARLLSVGILLGALSFYAEGTMPLARCLLVLIASYSIYQELESAGNMTDNLQMLAASMDKANTIDATPVMDTDGADIQTENASITFEGVSFSYGDRRILDHVNLTIPEGTTTAIVGPSGGGKTTLCNLIARFWDVQSGSIKVGGVDVRKYKLDSLMKNISMVFQSVYLFNDTIENNIKFGKQDASREEVIRAAKAACCHDFIAALPNGYDTVLGEAGGTLSGGEKQRLSIARAMLKDAPIILLDEATANVDPENEEELQKAIDALTHNKTIIMIAHRLKTVRGADQILVLEGGQITQRGTHEQLIQEKGLYADFIMARQEALGWKVSAAE